MNYLDLLYPPCFFAKLEAIQDRRSLAISALIYSHTNCYRRSTASALVPQSCLRMSALWDSVMILYCLR